jgi:hypothetical protein
MADTGDDDSTLGGSLPQPAPVRRSSPNSVGKAAGILVGTYFIVVVMYWMWAISRSTEKDESCKGICDDQSRATVFGMLLGAPAVLISILVGGIVIVVAWGRVQSGVRTGVAAVFAGPIFLACLLAFYVISMRA